MSVIAEFTVPTDSFLLKEALSAVPEMVVEIQRVVAQAEDVVVPFFWVQYGDEERFDEAIRSDPTVEDVVRLDEYERGTSYRARWAEHASTVAYAYLETGAVILEATGQNDAWLLRMRFDDDEALAAFHRHLREESIPFELEQLYRPDQPMAGGRYGLTPTQRETLVEAFQRGYYEIPRGTSMTDLAGEIGTTQQTLSKRFRRAHAALVENTLLVSGREPSRSDEPSSGI